MFFEHVGWFYKRLSSLIMPSAFKGWFIFSTKRDYIVFTIDFCCSMVTRERETVACWDTPHFHPELRWWAWISVGHGLLDEPHYG